MNPSGPNRPTPDWPPWGGAEPWSATDVWPAGWYADPWQSGRERRWTGSAWTPETRGAIGPAISGLGGPPAGPIAPQPEAAAAVATKTPATGWSRGRLIALVATLAVIAMIVGFTVTYVAADDSPANETQSTLPPSDTTTPAQPPTSNTSPSSGSTPSSGTTTPGVETPGSGSSGNGGNSGGGSANGQQPADPSADVLEQLVVRQSDVSPSGLVVPSDGGDSVAGAPTLDLCNGTFPSESSRSGRLQVVAIDPTGTPFLSTEAVLYRDAAATSQAFAELRAVVAACPSTPVESPVGESPVTTKFNAAPDNAWPQVAGVERQAYDFTTTDSTGETRHSVAVYLRRGRALVGVYFRTADTTQASVDGNTTIPSIVNVFAERLAAVPASAIGA